MRKDKVPTRMKNVRIEKNMTQRDLAEASGVPQDRISRYENGQPMNTDTLIRILKALEVSADYFLGLVNKDTKWYLCYRIK